MRGCDEKMSEIMEPGLFTESFELIKVLDSYKSLIWTERYMKCGEFEYRSAVTKELLDNLIIGRYLALEESDAVMFIETIEITTNVTTGNELCIKGRSIGSMLDRRIIWNQTDLNSKLEAAIERLLNENIMQASDEGRRIPGFIFVPSGDQRLDSITIDKQYTGDNLLEVIETLCTTYHVGWRVTFHPDDPNARFRFQLYLGESRTYDQDTLPWVAFSPKYGNLIGSNYTKSKRIFKNVAHVKGEGEGLDRKSSTIIISDGPMSPTGLLRREMYVDARDISQDSGEHDEEGNPIKIPDSEYFAKLRERGREKLAECEDETVFDGEADVYNGMFVYGKDFFIGDIVEIENEYELGDTVRVTELIRSGDENGFITYPTFTSTTKKEEVST